ncbi:MAG: anhydro-N-acetylmuramic acid kinase [Candidatus Eiseniibacteriota bacterium]
MSATRDPAAEAGAPADALAGVRDYLRRAEHLVVGLMTGTSADAVDAALVRFTGLGLGTTHTLVRYRESPLEESLRREILDVAGAGNLAPERLMRLDAALGERYAASVLELVAEAGVDPAQVDAIGCHGQTVRHLPRSADPSGGLTLQLGSAAILAERTGITVVSDFRTRDIAAGGEGAPLVPLVDWWLCRSDDESRVLLNLGGIANLTFLPRGGAFADLVAFDTGPCNAVLDALAWRFSGGAERRDDGGARASRGRASQALLLALLDDPYFAQPPPRSTGRERYGAAYAAAMHERARVMMVEDDDLMATAVELVAAAVADAVARFLAPRGGASAVYASGGGVRNPALMSALARRLDPARLAPAESLGLSSDAKEALAFAFLAHQTLCGRPGNVPAATGAAHPAVLGHLTPGALR